MYAEWNEDGPVHRGLPGLWVVGGYADARHVLKDHRHFSNDYRNSRGFRRRPRSNDGLERIARAVGEVDPPDHARLRELLSTALTPEKVERLVPEVHASVDRLLEPLEERARSGEVVDIVEALALPLPVTVIGGVLGIPAADWEPLRRWSEDVLFAGDPFILPQDMARANAAANNLAEYFLALGAERRRRPRDDLVSTLIRALDDGRLVSEEEYLSACAVLMVAGHTTTLNLIANGIHALVRNPAQLRRLHAHPDLLGDAVEELLRYDAPVHFMRRVTLEDVDLEGHRIPKGDRVYVALAAANRDPARFAEPEVLDIARPHNRHLSFGLGIHFCLGAHLGRLEGQAAIGSVVSRLPRLALADEPPKRNTQIAIPRLETLPLVLDGRSPSR